jgi:hypothetical protein
MRDFRIVVTGSRHWTDPQLIIDALVRVMSMSGDHRFIIVHGDAKGADTIARAWAEERMIPCEAWPANWDAEGKGAGPKRNRRMLDAGARIVLAFPIGGRATSPGTHDCIDAACERGIQVRVFPAVAP